jgi:hypothetical protein
VLVRLLRFAPGVSLVAKAEFMLPSGSAYDRVARGLLEDVAGRAVVAGSGSVGLAFAAAAAALKRELAVVVPARTLPEHLLLLDRFPAEVVRCEGRLFDTHARALEVPGELVFSPCHGSGARVGFASSLGAELAAMFAALREGPPERLVAPLDGGALLFGAADGLAERGFAVRTLATVVSGPSLQDGVLEAGDASPEAREVEVVTDERAHAARMALARTEGLLVGMGSAAAAHAAREAALRGERVCVLLVDAGDRYFSVDRKLKGSRRDGSDGSDSNPPSQVHGG